MAKTFQLIVAGILIQLFFSVGMNLYVYALPDDAVNQAQVFTQSQSNLDLTETSDKVEETMGSFTDMPLYDVGALVFYSGNILLDLLINFLYALPAMFSILINGLENLFNFDSVITANIYIFASVAITIMYMIGLLNLLTSIRSGRVIE